MTKGEREWPKCKHGRFLHIACRKCGRSKGPHMNDACKCKACVELKEFLDSGVIEGMFKRTHLRLTPAQKRDLQRGD